MVGASGTGIICAVALVLRGCVRRRRAASRFSTDALHVPRSEGREIGPAHGRDVQDGALFSSLTRAREKCRIPVLAHHLTGWDAGVCAGDLADLKKLPCQGLPYKAGGQSSPSELSGGYAQEYARRLARALAPGTPKSGFWETNPRLGAGPNFGAAAFRRALIRRIKRQPWGCGCSMVTHDLDRPSCLLRPIAVLAGQAGEVYRQRSKIC